MSICKLCREPVVAAARADKNLCKECYTDLARYRRLIPNTRMLEPYQLSFKNRMDELFERNKANGWFVPKFYIVGAARLRCTRCTHLFQAYSYTGVCPECARVEAGYRSAIDKGLKTVVEYEAYYRAQKEKGREVPRLYDNQSSSM